MNSLLGDPLVALSKLAKENECLIASLLRSGDKLSETERYLAAFLIDGQALLPEKKKSVGRQRKVSLNSTDWRNMIIALEYEGSYEPSASEACFEQIKDNYKFKSISSAKKAVERGRKLLDPYLRQVSENDGIK